MTMTTPPSFSQKGTLYDHDHHSCPSQQKRRAFEKKALYGHDHHPFPWPAADESVLKEGSVWP